MARASRRSPRTPPTPGKARRLALLDGPGRSARAIDLAESRTIGEVCARIAAAIDVPLQGEDDASALGRLAHALSNDPRSCTFLNLDALPDALRDLVTSLNQRISRRALRARLGRSKKLFVRRTKEQILDPAPESAWRGPHLDLAIRMLRGSRGGIPEGLRSALRLTANPSSRASAAASDSARSLARAAAAQVDDSLTELLAILPALRRRGPLSLELDLLDEWLEGARTAHADPWLRARTLMARGDALRQLGRLEEARIDLEEARALARGEASLESEVIALLGRLHHHAARHEEAQMHYERALALAAESHDGARVVDTLLDLATLLRDTSQARDALPYAERALSLHKSANAQKVKRPTDFEEEAAIRHARAAALVATLLHAEAMHEEAREAYAAAIEAAHHAGQGALLASSLANLGLLERQCGRRVEARATLLRAADRFARIGMAHAEGRSRLAAALVIVDVDAASAVEDAEDAALLFAPDGPAPDETSAHAAAAALAFAHAEAGDRIAARLASPESASNEDARSASRTSASSTPTTRALLTALVRARLLLADAAESDRAGARVRADELRSGAYQMYEEAKTEIGARPSAPSEISDATGAARSLLRSLERVLSSRITPPSDRPSKTRRFF